MRNQFYIENDFDENKRHYVHVSMAFGLSGKVTYIYAFSNRPARNYLAYKT